MQFLSDCWSRLVFEFAKFRWGQTHLRQYFLWALAPVLALLLYQIIFRSRRRRQTRSRGAPVATALWPGLDSEFYQIERSWRSGARRASRASRFPAGSARQHRPGAGRDEDRLRELLRLHYRYRFDPQGLSQADREALRREVGGCLARMG